MIFYLQEGKICSHKNPVHCEEAILETYNKMKLYYEPIKKDIYGGFAKLSKIWNFTVSELFFASYIFPWN